MQASMKTITILAITAVISVSALGIGFAHNYMGTTQSSSSDYDVKYIVIELDDTIADSYTNTFKFASPTYYADTAITGSSMSVSYRVPAYTKNSDLVKIETSGANTTDFTMNVKLETDLPSGATLKLQFYASDATTTVGNQITLTYDPSGSGTDVSSTMTCGSIYYCMATYSFEGGTFNSVPSDVSFNVRLTATADTEAS